MPKPAKPRYTPPASLAPKAKGAPAPASKAAPAAAPAAASGATGAGLALRIPELPASGRGYVVASGAAFDSNNLDGARLPGSPPGARRLARLTAPALGVEWQQSAGDLAILVELGVLATLIEGLQPQPQVFAFVRRLRETTFFASLGHGEGLEEALDALEKLGQEPWARPLFERLVHARFVARRASSKIDLLYQVRNAASGKDAVQALREHLTGAQFAEAPFWVLRELVRLGVIADPKAVADCVVVPNARLIANAVRIGLATTTDISDFDTFVALSQAASKVAGSADAGYGAALERLDDGLGLRA
ncbi:MAG: hypothetical protein U1F43_36575 [Myxococcota bacterium]